MQSATSKPCYSGVNQWTLQERVTQVAGLMLGIFRWSAQVLKAAMALWIHDFYEMISIYFPE
jgi:hypothetical protein